MKKLFILFIISAFFNAKAQVGINTTNPQGTLEVVGGTLIESYVIDTSNSVATGNYFLLTRSKDTTPIGKVKMLDISLRNVAPVNAYKIILKNVKQDEVVNLNSGLDVNKYVVAITGAVFSDAFSASNTTTNFASYGAYSAEITKIVNGGNTYYGINLDFKGANTVSGQNGTWTLNLVVYEKSLVKDWGTFNGSVSGYETNPPCTGTSNNTPAGLQ